MSIEHLARLVLDAFYGNKLFFVLPEDSDIQDDRDLRHLMDTMVEVNEFPHSTPDLYFHPNDNRIITFSEVSGDLIEIINEIDSDDYLDSNVKNFLIKIALAKDVK